LTDILGSMMRRIIAAAVLLLFSSMCTGMAQAVDGANVFDLSNTDVTILNPDSLEVIGHAHYKVTHQNRAMIFEGENRFLNGEYDREVQRVELRADDAPPVLIKYVHSFFNADGSPESIDALDASSGMLTCTHFHGNATPDVRQSKVEVPADTYVGSTQLMLLVGRLREGAHAIAMHTFICLPGPHIIPLTVTPPVTNVKWAMHPGDLVKVELVPDFGWLGALTGPFVPKAYGWFDPSDDYNYVGGLFDRFYRHRHLMMVRAASHP
jgi:hypothetical protein